MILLFSSVICSLIFIRIGMLYLMKAKTGKEVIIALIVMIIGFFFLGFYDFIQ